jgi:hypothetical protein
MTEIHPHPVAQLRLARAEQIDDDRTYRVEFGGLEFAKRMDGRTLHALLQAVTDPRRLTFQAS